MLSWFPTVNINFKYWKKTWVHLSVALSLMSKKNVSNSHSSKWTATAQWFFTGCQKSSMVKTVCILFPSGLVLKEIPLKSTVTFCSGLISHAPIEPLSLGEDKINGFLNVWTRKENKWNKMQRNVCVFCWDCSWKLPLNVLERTGRFSLQNSGCLALCIKKKYRIW